MCLAVWSHEEQLPEIEEYALRLTANTSTLIILYQVKKDHPNYYDFPVNLFRNICIRNLHTSHFMVLDIDMWPTPLMYQHLIGLSDSVLDDATHAIVIPPVFLNSKKIGKRCSRLSKCFQL